MSDKILTKWMPQNPKQLTINYRLLPEAIADILKNFLIPLNYGTPELALLLQTETILAQIVGYRRLKVTTSYFTTPTNLYSIIFMPSGEGKDRPLFHINEFVANDVHQQFENDVDTYIALQEKAIEEKASKLYKVNSKRYHQYIEDNKPRYLIRIIGSGTAEGLTAIREAYALAPMGATFIKISEFGSYIKSGSETKDDFLRLLTDIYDMGDSEPKIIKGEVRTRSVKGVPSNALLYSSLSGFEEGAGWKRLQEFFNRGLARRSFVCYPFIDKKLRQMNIARIIKHMELQDATIRKANVFKHLFGQTYQNVCSYPEKTLSKEAELLYHFYNHFCIERSKKIGVYEQEGFRAELRNRSWKMLKLAGIIGAVNGDTVVLSENTIGQAIYQTELFGASFFRFFTNEQPDEVEKLFHYLRKATKGGRWITTMDIRKQSFVHANYFGKWFNEMVGRRNEAGETGELYDYVMEQGFMLKQQVYGRNGRKFKLVPFKRVK